MPREQHPDRGPVGHRKIAVDIHLVVCQQLIDVGERRTRYTFRDHLRATGMVSLNHVLRIFRLREEAKYFLK